MSSEPTTGVAAGTEPRRIDYDLRCHGCGYNLRTMAVEGRCPECNEPVAVTLEVMEIAGEPEWLGRIRAGLALYPVVVAAGVLLVLAAYLEPMLVGAHLRGDMPYALYLVSRLMLFVLLTAMPAVLGWWYEWLITSPRSVGVFRKSIHRRVMRGVIVAGIALWAVRGIFPGARPDIASSLLGWLSTALIVAWAWCIWRWMETIVTPLRRPGLGRHIRILQWVAPGGLVFQAAIHFGVTLYMGWTIPPLFSLRREVLFIFDALAALVTIGLAIWGFVTLLVIRHRLAQVESPPAKYFGDVKLAFLLLARDVRKVGGRIMRAAAYYGQASEEGKTDGQDIPPR